MDLATAFAVLNGEQKISSHHQCIIDRWRHVYYNMSLHTTGACPKFIPLDVKNLSLDRGWYCPPGYYGEEYQCIFEKRLFSRHPRESEYSRQWRFSQYKPLTKAPFRQIIQVITGAIFQDSNYDIQIESDRDREFIWSNSFMGYDLVRWYANVGIPSIMEDPNGLIIRMPLKPYYEISNGDVEVNLHFINTKDIIFYDGRVLIFKKDEFAFYVDDLVFFRFTRERESKYIVTTEDAGGYYAHMFGRLPVDVAGGIWNTQGFYDSYLDKAQAPADDFVSSYSAEQMVDKEASHPFIIMANEECGECQGVGKIQEPCDDCPDGQEFELVNCSACKGKGTMSVSPGDRLTADKKDMELDLVKIVNPDTGINTYHHDKNKDVYDRILHALHLYKVDKAESGEAKAIDQERLYTFVSDISSHIFDKLIYNSISEIIAYRNIGVINGQTRPINTPFIIQKPTQFQIETAADLLADLKVGAESKVPVYVRSQMLTEYVSKKWSGNDIVKRKNEISLQLDDIATLTPDEKLTMSTIGGITKEELLFSRKLPLIMDQIIREKGKEWFISSNFDVLKAEIERIFEPMKATIKGIYVPEEETTILLPGDSGGAGSNSALPQFN